MHHAGTHDLQPVVGAIAEIPTIVELNIGHFLILDDLDERVGASAVT